MDLIMALIILICGIFSIFIGGALFYGMSFMIFGLEAIFVGFMGVLMVLCGLMCFACLSEM